MTDFHAQNSSVDFSRTTTDWNTLLPKLTASVAAGSPPDLYYFDSPVETYGAATNNELVPLDDVIKKVGADKWPKNMLDAVTLNGKIYGFPLYTYPEILWYRKDLFQQAGLQPPTTLDNILAAARALNHPPTQYGTALYNDQDDPWIVAEVCAAFGCKLFDDSGKPAINSPETIQALDFLRELWKTTNPDAISKADLDARLIFYTGGAAMDFTSVSLSNELSKPTAKVKPEQVGAVPIPQSRTGVPSNPAPFANIVIPRGAKNVQMAKQFLEFWAQDAEMVKFGENTVIGHIPVMRSVSDPSSPYWSSTRISPLAPFIQAGIEGASTNGFVPGMYPKPSSCGPKVMAAGVYTQMLSHVVVDKWSSAQTATWAESQIKQICGL
jgi:multiple sugar transport system substrate-binding protein